MVRGSGPDPAPLGSIPGGCAGLGAKYLDQVCDIGMLYCSFITLCHAPSLGSTREACGLSCRSVQAMQAASVTTFPSATGTRTRVARVRAECPNQLDYNGFCFVFHRRWSALCFDRVSMAEKLVALSPAFPWGEAFR